MSARLERAHRLGRELAERAFFVTQRELTYEPVEAFRLTHRAAPARRHRGLEPNARAFEAKAGQYVTVVNLEGRQVGDFMVFNPENLKN